MSEEEQENVVPRTKGKWSPEKRKAFSERMKARAQNPAVRESLSQVSRARWDKPNAKERGSEAQLERYADPEAKSRHAAAMAKPETRRRISDSTKKHWASLSEEERNKRMSDLRRRFKGGHKLTSIEATTMMELNHRLLPYFVHFEIDVYVADLYVPSLKLVIECDGAWHHDQRKDTDDIRDAKLLALGYHTLRLTQTEIEASDWAKLDEIITRLTA